MAGNILTPGQQQILHDNTRIVHSTNLYRAYALGMSSLVRVAKMILDSGYETDPQKLTKYKELAAIHSRMPYAEAPFLFTGGRTTVGTFVVSLCRAHPQNGTEIEASEVIMGSKPIPGVLSEDGGEPEGFLHSEFGEDSLDIAVTRIHAQLAVGLSGTKVENLEVLGKLQISPGLDNVETL